jgi:predicted PurR-regulated permease PerM
LILVSTLGGLQVFGMAGLLIGPMLAAMFMTMIDVYQKWFHDELTE